MLIKKKYLKIKSFKNVQNLAENRVLSKEREKERER